MSHHIQQHIDQIVESFWRLNNATGLAVGVICHLPHAEPVVWTYLLGATHNGGPQPSVHTIFQIGSITKTFTTSILADACSDTTMRLQDDAQQWAPLNVKLPTYDTWNTSSPIRLEHLATQTAALPMDPKNVPPEGGYSVEQMYRYLEYYALAVEPGTSWNYSNTGFGLLANLLISAAKEPSYESLLIDFLRRGKFHMPDTRITLTPEQNKRLAQGYSAPGVVAKRRTDTWPAFDGSGALYSSLNDMLVWLEFNLSTQPCPMDRIRPLINTICFNDGVHRMSLAWQQYTFNGSGVPYWGKGGGTNGYASYIARATEIGCGVVALTNSVWAYPKPLATSILSILQESL
ncbi:MAG: serine hydrolase [Kamptonema sp. SIO1D9]|nr:serine hydrolase [Kamptonema sp. SIO1D9]